MTSVFSRRLGCLVLMLVLSGPGLGRESQKLQITSPAGGETWLAGSKHHVTWTAAESTTARRISIDFTADGGTTWTCVAADTPDRGSFLWSIPHVASARCLLKLRAVPSGESVQTSTVFAVGPSQKLPEYEWVQVTAQAAFAARDGAGALVFGGRMWLLGGWNPGDKKNFPRICNNEVWSSADGAAWSLVRPNTFLTKGFDSEIDWEGRHTAGYVVHRDKMWIVGGDVNQGHYHFDVWNSADGKNWSLVNRGRPLPWGPRALHYTVAFKDKIWIMGGQTIPQFAPGDEVFYRDIWNSEDGVSWNRVRPKEPYWSERGMIGGSAVFKNRIWILGGGTYDTPAKPVRKFYNDVWSSADGVAWTRHIEKAPWQARQYHDVAVFDGRLWVLEGYNQTNRNDVWHSADGENWYEVPATPWKPRHAASVFVFANALWMVAGNNMESDVWKLQRKRVR